MLIFPVMRIRFEAPSNPTPKLHSWKTFFWVLLGILFLGFLLWSMFRHSAASPVPSQAALKQKPSASKTASFAAPVLDLKNPKTFGTKSSTFQTEWLSSENSLEWRYDLPEPTSSGGITFSAGNGVNFQASHLKFRIQNTQTSETPLVFRVEIRLDDRVLRVFSGKLTDTSWQSFDFPIQSSSPLSFSEIALSLSHAKAGDEKKGALRIKDFVLT